MPWQPALPPTDKESFARWVYDQFLSLAKWLTGTVYYSNISLPSSAINLRGAAADPTRSTTTGLLEFSGTADNVIAGAVQFPNGWSPKHATIRPHIHIRFPTSAAANTRWKFEYDFGNDVIDFANAYGTYTTLGTITVANPQNVNSAAHADFGSIDMSGASDEPVLVYRISRLANSDAADTDTNYCVLLDVDIHFYRNALGLERKY